MTKRRFVLWRFYRTQMFFQDTETHQKLDLAPLWLVHAHELHEHRFTVFFLAKLNLSVLDWSTSQFISYEEPTDQTESFWFGMTFQRRFGARPLSVQNSRKSEQQPFKPHRINKSQTRKKKMVLYDDGQSLPPKESMKSHVSCDSSWN